jgi:hypothetical protein
LAVTEVIDVTASKEIVKAASSFFTVFTP